MDGSEGRAKRQKIDKHGRMSALEKLRQLKGSKRKYEVDTLENVYDTVNEDEYTERVLKRQNEDWIQDDDGCGYVEDGREIFDDEELDEADSKNKEGRAKSAKNPSVKSAKKRKAVSAAAVAPVSSKGSIHSMLSNMPNRKKEEVKLSDDNILSDIMSEIDPNQTITKTKASEKTTSNVLRSNNFAQRSKRDAEDYFKNLDSNSKTKNVFKNPSNEAIAINKKIMNIEEHISPVTSPIKVSPKIDKTIIKIEKTEVSPSQHIEEYNTQDLHFDDIDFDEDSMQENAIKKEPNTELKVAKESNDNLQNISGIKVEEKPTPKTPNIKDVKTDSFGSPNQMNDVAVEYDANSFPMFTQSDGSKNLRIYWWDAWEDRFVKPGVVFLFGKVYVNHARPTSGSVSICVSVRNIQRKLYLLPREYKLDPITLEEDTDSPVSINDVYQEFNEKVAATLDIKEFRSRKVMKKYAFDLVDVPVEAEYLEVRYAATHPPPPKDKIFLTFSHVFGANTSSLEIFLLENKIKGPCWLDIKCAESVPNKLSWCKVEANCSKPEYVTVVRDCNTPPPPLTIATINTRTMIDPKTRANMIVMLSCLVTNSYGIQKPAPNPQFQQHFCVITRPTGDIWPTDFKHALTQYTGTKVTKCDTERELLSYFLVQFWKLDPDIVLGHDLYGYQQDLLIGNILNKSIPNWSRLGRLKRTVVPQRKFAAKDAFLGRLVCDIKLSSMELIRSRSFDLNTLCSNVLKLSEGGPSDILAEDLCKYYENSADLLDLVSMTMQDTTYILRLMFELNVMPLALQITQIAGNIMSRTLMGGRSERNEFLLLHAFTEKNYIVPDKEYGKKSLNNEQKFEGDTEIDPQESVSKKQIQSRKKPQYAGGLVLDPKKGFYENLILLMDFNSLYPSIIQEYNICFTTIKRSAMKSSEDDINEMALPDSSLEPGILPTEIRKLVESRREVKKLMKVPDLYPEQYMQYNIRQMALKLTANSMYGCLGFAHSRFYAKPLAALVTMKGREILINTKDMVSKLNYDVIYGDTDSIMINTNCLDYDQVFKIGYEIKKEINKKYKQVELDIDGVFRYLLLLKKKKYAAVLLSKNKNGEFVTTQELKGIDIVRRDWSQLAAEAGKFILNQILSEQAPDDRLESIQNHLSKLMEDLKENKMPLSLLTITKQLTKNPNEYADKSSQPHVQIAIRMNNKNGRQYKKSDIVPYIICDDGTSNPAMQRAYHIEELKASKTLKVDVNYYLAHQLHPVISRICDPIDGMDSARIANILGLDPSAYKHSIKREIADDAEDIQIENEKEKYRQCTDFYFLCLKCKTKNIIREAFRQTANGEYITFLEKCQNENCLTRPFEYLPHIQNQLTIQMRNYNGKYYENWLICEDPACTNRTVKLPHCFTGGYPICNLCEKGVMFREYTEKDLYYQICFLHYLFDVNKQNVQKVKLHPQIVSGFHSLKECVEDVLSHSAYSVINLDAIFSLFNMKTKKSANVKTEPLDLNFAPDVELDDFKLDMELNYE